MLHPFEAFLGPQTVVDRVGDESDEVARDKSRRRQRSAEDGDEGYQERSEDETDVEHTVVRT